MTDQPLVLSPDKEISMGKIMIVHHLKRYEAAVDQSKLTFSTFSIHVGLTCHVKLARVYIREIFFNMSHFIFKGTLGSIFRSMLDARG